MRLSFIDLESLTGPKQNFVSLLVGQGQVNKVVYEATELIENQVCISLQLKLLLLFLCLD